MQNQIRKINIVYLLSELRECVLLRGHLGIKIYTEITNLWSIFNNRDERKKISYITPLFIVHFILELRREQDTLYVR